METIWEAAERAVPYDATAGIAGQPTSKKR
jgi:hypothetical protein